MPSEVMRVPPELAPYFKRAIAKFNAQKARNAKRIGRTIGKEVLSKVA